MEHKTKEGVTGIGTEDEMTVSTPSSQPRLETVEEIDYAATSDDASSDTSGVTDFVLSSLPTPRYGASTGGDGQGYAIAELPSVLRMHHTFSTKVDDGLSFTASTPPSTQRSKRSVDFSPYVEVLDGERRIVLSESTFSSSKPSPRNETLQPRSHRFLTSFYDFLRDTGRALQWRTKNRRLSTSSDLQSHMTHPRDSALTGSADEDTVSLDAHHNVTVSAVSDAPSDIEAQEMKLTGYAWWFIGPENRFRLLMLRMTSSDLFEYVMFFMILLSCIAMTFERPSIQPGSFEDTMLFYLDACFTAVFGLEFLMKSIALSFSVYIQTLTNKVRQTWRCLVESGRSVCLAGGPVHCLVVDSRPGIGVAGCPIGQDIARFASHQAAPCPDEKRRNAAGVPFGDIIPCRNGQRVRRLSPLLYHLRHPWRPALLRAFLQVTPLLLTRIHLCPKVQRRVH